MDWRDAKNATVSTVYEPLPTFGLLDLLMVPTSVISILEVCSLVMSRLYNCYLGSFLFIYQSDLVAIHLIISPIIYQ